MTQTKTRRRFTVRKQSSGYTFSETFYVYDLDRQGRVSVHAQLHRSAAQADADALEVQAMVVPAAEDPRPYVERLADAQARFAAGETARS